MHCHFHGNDVNGKRRSIKGKKSKKKGKTDSLINTLYALSFPRNRKSYSLGCILRIKDSRVKIPIFMGMTDKEHTELLWYSNSN